MAVEARYHRKCYYKYVRDGPTKTGEREDRTTYDKAFETFCVDVVDKRLIQNKEILLLTFLVTKFNEAVKDVDGIDVSYQSSRLKARIRKKYPDMVFHTSKTMQKGTLVYSAGLTVGEIADDSLEFEDDIESDYDDECCGEIHTQKAYSSFSTLYAVALEMRNELRECKGIGSHWPPDSNDLNMEAAMKSIPVKLFNFISWLVGYSEEPNQGEQVALPEKASCKIVSLCQDLVYAAGKGKVLTHKSLALGMTVRQLTGSTSLIKILHGLGHCVSSDTIYKHDSALTLATTQHNDEVCIPRNITSNKFTCLVWDNNDFQEETVTGKGTTHVTNGIIIQRSSHDSYMRRKKMVPKHVRSVVVPPVEILPYFNKRKGEPSIANQYPNVQIPFKDAALSQEQIVSRKIDLMYLLCKQLSASVNGDDAKSILPCWTGFNTHISKGSTKPLSVVGYLPIIDAPVTELSTVFTLLKKSMRIAEKLSLPEIVLVFDEAVYAKAQMIRWTNQEMMSKIAIRLGAFHTIMSFCSGISRIFKDAGLKVILSLSNLLHAAHIKKT